MLPRLARKPWSPHARYHGGDDCGHLARLRKEAGTSSNRGGKYGSQGVDSGDDSCCIVVQLCLAAVVLCVLPSRCLEERRAHHGNTRALMADSHEAVGSALLLRVK